MKNKYNFIALFPMRKDSERIKKKNIKKLCGKPMYHYIVESLHNCEYIDTIVIDTDSEIIAKNSYLISNKVKIIDRPQHLHSGMVSMNDIIKHDLSLVDGDFFLQTHSTNPLISTQTLNLSIESYIHNIEKFDSLFSVTRHQKRFFLDTKDGNVTPLNHNLDILLRTQDIPPIFEQNGCVYIFSRSSFNVSKNRIGALPQMYETPPLESISIDNQSDFYVCEALLK
jgi:CMP-N-acetylneuraminic acid synthetase